MFYIDMNTQKESAAPHRNSSFQEKKLKIYEYEEERQVSLKKL